MKRLLQSGLYLLVLFVIAGSLFRYGGWFWTLICIGLMLFSRQLGVYFQNRRKK
ncbi:MULTISPECIES: hypothetical protein [Loigolactobacillus]|uniref:hypothetical protein n=1 Tax=Loigolactobacillus TaxID=2767889 RepID=UPI000A8A54B6|nr:MULTISPECIES: hypothetical protein [Loigolactobacillus]MDA5388502.1 hypothetical protein [Loigolactobacillus backii]MDA5390976.1 hypothetical protein [Loigolactobacillus backii]